MAAPVRPSGADEGSAMVEPEGLPEALGGRQAPQRVANDLRSVVATAAMQANARVLARHLPRGPMVAVEQFPGLGTLAESASVVREEWSSLRSSLGRLPTVDWLIDRQPGWDGAWESYGILGPTGWSEHARRSVPRTVGLLEQIDGLEHASFSVLSPGAYLHPHRGQNTGVVRGLLGVVVEEPDRCGMLVETQRVGLAEGELLCFDDTFEHAAWNLGGVERVALMLEVRWPLTGFSARCNALSQLVYRRHPMVGDAFGRLERFLEEHDPAPVEAG